MNDLFVPCTEPDDISSNLIKTLAYIYILQNKYRDGGPLEYVVRLPGGRGGRGVRGTIEYIYIPS